MQGDYEQVITLIDAYNQLNSDRINAKEAEVGKNYPPMHPNCRSITVEVYDEEVILERAARDPITGEHILVPGDMSYEDWHKQFVEGKEKELEKVVENDRLKISGAITDIFSNEANKHAELYYEEIRKQNTDVKRIALNTGYEEKQIDEIKRYLFIDEHELSTGKRRFDPNFAIAQSWQRLEQGNIEKHDLILLEHEVMERNLIATGKTQDEAHRLASKKHNYREESMKYYAELNKRKKRK